MVPKTGGVNVRWGKCPAGETSREKCPGFGSCMGRVFTIFLTLKRNELPFNQGAI
jgi:hypothetical protein